MNKLQKYLKNKGISQIDFAKKIGTAPNNLNLIVNGKSIPGLTLAYEIEKMTGGVITLYDWLPDESKKKGEEIDDE